jgi:hypothetical protein
MKNRPHFKKLNRFFMIQVAHTLWAFAAFTSSPAAAKTVDFRGQEITVEEGMVLVDVMVNGHGPFRMIVDTGAVSCVLKPESAKKVELVYDHRVALATLNGNAVVPGASNNVVQVGERSETKVDILITEIPQFSALRSKPDGVLGQAFLSRMPFLIDYRRKRILLGEEAAQDAERLPIAMTAAGTRERLIVPVVLEPGGKIWRLTLDSGASALIIECLDNCPKSAVTASSEQLKTYSGEQSISRSTFKRATIGRVAMPAIDGVIVNVVPPDDRDEGVLPTRLFSVVYVDNLNLRLAR